MAIKKFLLIISGLVIFSSAHAEYPGQLKIKLCTSRAQYWGSVSKYFQGQFRESGPGINSKLVEENERILDKLYSHHKKMIGDKAFDPDKVELLKAVEVFLAWNALLLAQKHYLEDWPENRLERELANSCINERNVTR